MTVVTAPSGPRANARPFLYGDELTAIARVLESGQYGHGTETEAFERDLAAYLDVPDVVAVSTGTAALHLALLAVGVGPGDEVVVPSLTFCASVQAITATGARPRFVDVDPATLCTTADHIRAGITPATRAVMPVLYGGRAIDLTSLRDDLTAQGIAIVEDAAHAFGSFAGDRRVGATGDLTCFSFDAIKALTCGDGGAVIPRDPSEATVLHRMRALGITGSRIQRGHALTYAVEGPGFRYHLSTLHAAIGRVQLSRFPEMESRRRTLWSTYATALHGIGDVTLVDLDVANTVPFNCTVLLPAPLRDEVHTRLRAADIAVGVHYPLNHRQPAFTPWATPLPQSESVWPRILNLPFHPDMTENDVYTVAAALRRALRLAAGRASASAAGNDQDLDQQPSGMVARR
ncbi:DegT/DnrJ/EryC1/StrS family aminotransferase [Amycolatopsis alba]|uniref:DegT/DnrJ/EryC1/StrS family aminotransferase n=1 Tax=Amycolatopsis alba DSM 44262 TaxID=1125972 RepID=A0A229RE92_AMYAL|nr:DegT/DnrJ/EryC1/StrS family aminotransferase [Amycolatopsis alba]OXM44799.1 DegT/DnrJ/EryC1/StrS family aminotransferase [Amycolatopsis alba DSM 44262]